uniref:ADP-ribosyl cyclase/cyclic ADP-ribose hydrolase 1 n=1 Tax=Engystomops pustulosus TaxID=76066 RepID=A0AAV6YJG7_ENGPU|nr:hypothetical protein GDO81_024692 [Engystomops pustulosus]
MNKFLISKFDSYFRNSCDSASLMELENYIEEHKLKYSCIDNYRPVQALQCADNPDHAACNKCTYL